jgi:hypothetical protein
MFIRLNKYEIFDDLIQVGQATMSNTFFDISNTQNLIAPNDSGIIFLWNIYLDKVQKYHMR